MALSERMRQQAERLREPLTPDVNEALRKLTEHSKALMEALADIARQADYQFKGHPGREFIDREQAMRNVLRIRDAHTLMHHAARVALVAAGRTAGVTTVSTEVVKLALTDGVPASVPVNRPATMEEARHAAQIGACLPNGVLFDAFGRERVRYVRVIHDGTTCVVPPGDVADLVDSEHPEDYRTEDVYLSEEEFDALPEFSGF